MLQKHAATWMSAASINVCAHVTSADVYCYFREDSFGCDSVLSPVPLLVQLTDQPEEKGSGWEADERVCPDLKKGKVEFFC